MESDSEINLNRTDTTLLILATKSREAIVKKCLSEYDRYPISHLFKESSTYDFVAVSSFHFNVEDALNK